MGTLIWNEVAKSQFKTYIEKNESSKRPVFLIIIGPEGIGKTSFLRSYSNTILWEYSTTDLFWMKDCTKELGKYHSIQIETPDKQKTIPLSDNLSYENKWVREINSWLQQSSFSWKKILLIENIQRMTQASMNAFLKTCEEPLPNRYLFATAEHESWILPTILSRAMVIRFSPLSDSEMAKYINDNFSDIKNDEKEILIKLSMWKPWTFHEIYKKVKENPEILGLMKELLPIMMGKGDWFKKIDSLKKLDEAWFLDIFQIVLIKEYTEQHNSSWAQAWINVKKQISSNVNQENALRYWILSNEN